jgi:hypothetical protein
MVGFSENIGLHKTLKNSSVSKRLLDYKENLRSMELITFIINGLLRL